MEKTEKDKAKKNKLFTYFVTDFDSKNKIYTLENPVTNDVKKISKEEFDMRSNEQKNKAAPPPLKTRKKRKKR